MIKLNTLALAAALLALPATQASAYVVSLYDASPMTTLAQADAAIAGGAPTVSFNSSIIEFDDLGDGSTGLFAVNNAWGITPPEMRLGQLAPGDGQQGVVGSGVFHARCDLLQRSRRLLEPTGAQKLGPQGPVDMNVKAGIAQQWHQALQGLPVRRRFLETSGKQGVQVHHAVQVEHGTLIVQTLASRQSLPGHAVGLTVQAQRAVGQRKIGLHGGLAPQVGRFAVLAERLVQAAQSQGVVGVPSVQGP